MKIQVSGGYTDEVGAEVRDRRGNDLSTATFKARLLSVDVVKGSASFPPASDAGWLGVSATTGVSEGDGVSRAHITLPVHGGMGLGKYYLWVLLQVGAINIPILASNEILELV